MLVWLFPENGDLPFLQHQSSAVHFPMTTPHMVALAWIWMILLGQDGFNAMSILSPFGSTRSCLNVAVWSSSRRTTTMLPFRASRQGSDGNVIAVVERFVITGVVHAFSDDFQYEGMLAVLERAGNPFFGIARRKIVDRFRPVTCLNP